MLFKKNLISLNKFTHCKILQYIHLQYTCKEWIIGYIIMMKKLTLSIHNYTIILCIFWKEFQNPSVYVYRIVVDVDN